MSLAVDLSNYTSAPLRVGDVQCWMANGVDRAIIQAVQGGGRFPPGQTPQQLQVCTEAGVRTDGYVLPFDGDGLSNLRAKHDLTKGYRIGRWWGDFEEPMGLDYVRFVLNEMDTWQADYQLTGVYIGLWWVFNLKIDLSEFANRPLWIMDSTRAAGSPSLRDPRVPNLTAWTSYAMHQYWLDASLCGISGIDVSYVNPDWSEGGSTSPMAIIVGDGMKNQMASAGDHPFFGHAWSNFTDEEGIPHQTEECYGTKGRYVSVETNGDWENAGPF